jgi:hypothetical protein
MPSKTNVCNLAIAHLGEGKMIANVDTDQSEEAAACRQVYELALRATLREYPWPFAKKIEALGLVETEPTAEWGYSYTLPPDCIRALRILSGDRNDDAQSKEPYWIMYGASSSLIYSDLAEADLEYVYFCEDVLRYPPDFIIALSYRIAILIAPRIASATTLADTLSLLRKAHDREIGKAWATAAHEQQLDEPPDSEFERAR